MPQQAESLEQDPLEGFVKPLVFSQAPEPWRRSRTLARFRLQLRTSGEPVQHVELASPFGRHFQKLKPPPFPALEKYRAMLLPVPRTEFLTPVLGRPHANRENPGTRIGSEPACTKQGSDALFDDMLGCDAVIANDNAPFIVVAQQALGGSFRAG